MVPLPGGKHCSVGSLPDGKHYLDVIHIAIVYGDGILAGGIFRAFLGRASARGPKDENDRG